MEQGAGSREQEQEHGKVTYIQSDGEGNVIWIALEAVTLRPR